MRNLANMLEASLQSYDYKLDSSLIANTPIKPKSAAKLLVYDRKSDSITHSTFKDFFSFIPKDTLIVLNDTKVLPARIYGRKLSGAKVELLYHKALDKNTFLAQIKGRVKVGDTLEFGNMLSAKVLELRDSGLRVLRFYHQNNMLDSTKLISILEQVGHIPLPPYIKREDRDEDKIDYQSVFAKNLGSIAAPTASLHFSPSDFKKLQSLNHCFISLHIGAGTFFSVESSDIREHKMHKESYEISNISKEKIDNADKILCIGTTATRCIEHYARSGIEKGECDIFINPLNPPLKTNFLLTNFHLPKSSLIMLVAGFIGVEKTKEIYDIAIEKRYRFYSYGDGMLIL